VWEQPTSSFREEQPAESKEACVRGGSASWGWFDRPRAGDEVEGATRVLMSPDESVADVPD
jgi:hypothetical protein